jgi:hypothetical protein
MLRDRQSVSEVRISPGFPKAVALYRPLPFSGGFRQLIDPAAPR